MSNDAMVTVRGKLLLTFADDYSCSPMQLHDANGRVIGYCTIDKDGSIVAHVPIEYADQLKQRKISFSVEGEV